MASLDLMTGPSCMGSPASTICTRRLVSAHTGRPVSAHAGRGRGVAATPTGSGGGGGAAHKASPDLLWLQGMTGGAGRPGDADKAWSHLSPLLPEVLPPARLLQPGFLSCESLKVVRAPRMPSIFWKLRVAGPGRHPTCPWPFAHGCLDLVRLPNATAPPGPIPAPSLSASFMLHPMPGDWDRHLGWAPRRSLKRPALDTG